MSISNLKAAAVQALATEGVETEVVLAYVADFDEASLDGGKTLEIPCPRCYLSGKTGDVVLIRNAGPRMNEARCRMCNSKFQFYDGP